MFPGFFYKKRTLGNSEFTYKIFGALLRQKSYKKGSYIYHQDEAALGVYRVLKGRVKLQKKSSKPRSIIFYLIHPSEVFGMLELLMDKRKRRCDAIALDKEVIIEYIPLSEFKKNIENDPVIVLSIIQILVNQEKSNWSKYCELQTRNNYKKVFRAILKLAKKRGIQTPKGIALKGMGHQDLANYIGVSRQSVTSTLIKLKQENKIEYNRKQIIITSIKEMLDYTSTGQTPLK